MTFWSGEKLAANRSVVDPFDQDQIDCNAYTLRMGGAYYRTGERETGYEQKKTTLADGEAFLIPAGQFAFLLSKETVRIPLDTMAFISMRTGIKFQGLINVSGFHVDPGYEGKLIYAVYNARTPLVMLMATTCDEFRPLSLRADTASGVASMDSRSFRRSSALDFAATSSTFDFTSGLRSLMSTTCMLRMTLD